MTTSGPVTVDTPLGPGAVTFVQMSGREAIGEPFEYHVDLVSEDIDIDPEDLLGQTMAIHLEVSGDKQRHFHGYVTSVDFVDHVRPSAGYRAIVRPWLWLLKNTTNCRIFQNKTIPAIVKQIFRDRGFTDFEESLSGEYEVVDYLVQYRESDFNFVSRLLEHAGIYYHFRHDSNAHTLVLADSSAGHQRAPNCGTLPYNPPDDHRSALAEYVDRWQLTQRITPGAVVLRDFDFERPKANLTASVSAPKGHAAADAELYDYPGAYRVKSDGEALARIRLEEHQEHYQEVTGHTNARGLAVGALFELTDYPRDDQNREYLVSWAALAIVGHDVVSGGADRGQTFSCEFGAIASSVQFRTPPRTRKPVVQGPQTAVVVGKAGEEIWTDKYGRIKVQFHWDREGQSDQNSSCWVRVSQVWAGANWGAMHIPRVGQEVIVEFLEGDPDRPIVTGRVYNASNMPPYSLSDNQTQSGIKSRSTKGGGVPNANEIRFEDKKGHEELYFQAERNQTTLVKANQSVSVGANRSVSVGADETVSVTANRTTTIGKKDVVTVKGEHEMTVSKKVTQTYLDDHAVKLTGNQTIEIGKNKTEHVTQTYGLTTDTKFELTQVSTTLTFQSNQVTLDAASVITVTRGPAKLTIDDSGQVTLTTPTGIKFECGPNTITMSPGGIEIKGPQITLKAEPSSLDLGPAGAKLAGATTTVEATTICSIKGTAMLNLNSG
jgi:type VI secretion system secreted protein VgrG